MRNEVLLPKGYEMTITPQPWIPVSERLPEPDVDVLVHFAISGREIGCIEGLSGGWLCAREVCSDEATHWMPLPEPPA
jgi:hypothetical protein